MQTINGMDGNAVLHNARAAAYMPPSHPTSAPSTPEVETDYHCLEAPSYPTLGQGYDNEFYTAQPETKYHPGAGRGRLSCPTGTGLGVCVLARHGQPL